MVDDALRGEPGEKVSMVLTNPPFGRRSSFTVPKTVPAPSRVGAWRYVYKVILTEQFVRRKDRPQIQPMDIPQSRIKLH